MGQDKDPIFNQVQNAVHPSIFSGGSRVIGVHLQPKVFLWLLPKVDPDSTDFGYYLQGLMVIERKSNHCCFSVSFSCTTSLVRIGQLTEMRVFYRLPNTKWACHFHPSFKALMNEEVNLIQLLGWCTNASIYNREAIDWKRRSSFTSLHCNEKVDEWTATIGLQILHTEVVILIVGHKLIRLWILYIKLGRELLYNHSRL